MNQEVNKQLIGGGDLTKSIIDGFLPKPKRLSQRQATKKVKNSVKGKKTKITQEQGFRNYMKYTDPLLLTNNEDIDRSDLADDINKLLDIFHPKQMKNDKIKEVENFVLKQEPVDVNDLASEVKVDRNKLADAASQRIQDNEERKNISATKIQKAYTRSKTKDMTKETQRQYEILKKIPYDKTLKTSAISGNIMPTMLSPQKRDKVEQKQKQAVQIIQKAVRKSFAINKNDYYEKIYNEDLKLMEKAIKNMEALSRINTIVKGHSVRKKVKPVLEKFKQTKEKPRLNKDGTFDKRYLGNHKSENEAAIIIQNAFKNRTSPVKTRHTK